MQIVLTMYNSKTYKIDEIAWGLSWIGMQRVTEQHDAL